MSPIEPVPSQLMWQGVYASTADKTAASQHPHAGAVASALAVLAEGTCVSEIDIRCAALQLSV